MRQALVEASKGRGWVEPNPLVGAVVVRDGQLVGVGHHERFGGAHAEINALHQAGDSARGATLFVTLEPCCHFGKTPPCTDAILAAEIARVVVAMRDPFPQVNGGGLTILEAAGLTVEIGCEADLARSSECPVFEEIGHGFALCDGQVGHDLGRQDRHRFRRQPLDLLGAFSNCRPRAARAHGCHPGRHRHG